MRGREQTEREGETWGDVGWGVQVSMREVSDRVPGSGVQDLGQVRGLGLVRGDWQGDRLDSRGLGTQRPSADFGQGSKEEGGGRR